MDKANDSSPALAPKEIVDLVDEEDHVLGIAPRREVRARNLLHREVAAIVRNAVGEIYVHRRADTKDVFPGMYDMFVAGVVTSGESYDDAVRRELAEELGVQGVEPALLFKSRYHDADINWWTCCRGARRAGAGTLLLKEVERIAVEAGCTAIEATSNRTAERDPAHRFYRGFGFIDGGVNERYFTKPLPTPQTM